MHQIRLRLGSAPDLAGGAYSACPDHQRSSTAVPVYRLAANRFRYNFVVTISIDGERISWHLEGLIWTNQLSNLAVHLRNFSNKHLFALYNDVAAYVV